MGYRQHNWVEREERASYLQVQIVVDICTIGFVFRLLQGDLLVVVAVVADIAVALIFLRRLRRVVGLLIDLDLSGRLVGIPVGLHELAIPMMQLHQLNAVVCTAQTFVRRLLLVFVELSELGETLVTAAAARAEDH